MRSSELLERPPRAVGETVLEVPSPRRPLFDVLGVVWVVVAAFVVMAPALRPGWSLGPFDLLSYFGLTYHAGAHVHNAIQADQIQQFVPWTYLAWHAVHQGQLPLWNRYNVLGMPLAFNWQSGVFSLPVAVGYLFPVHLAYTATVLTKLVVAGTGAYALCRVLGLGALAAAFGGTVFELSGPILVHSGWSMTGVTIFSGWIFTAVLLVFRSTHPWRSTLLLAVAVALAVYGGHPESLVVVALCTFVLVAVFLLAKGDVSGSRRGRTVLLVVGMLGGLGLSAPLLLPGLQLGFASTRAHGVGPLSFPISHVPNLLVSGLQGNDFRTAAYVGVITLAMAVGGARIAWHRVEVRALIAVGALTALLTFFGPLDQLLHLFPVGRSVDWARGVMVLALCLAVLGATGIDAIARSRVKGRDPVFVRWTTWTFGACGVVLVLVALGGFLGVSESLKANLARLIAPGVELVVGLALIWLPAGQFRSPRLSSLARWLTARTASLLVVTETAVLVVSGVGFWSVSNGYFPTNSGVQELQSAVGSSLVGLGTCKHIGYATPSTNEVGIRVDANIAYGIEEFAVYDPIMPTNYFRLWHTISGTTAPQSLYQLGVFCARITDAQEARVFGIGFVVEPSGRAGPVGSVPDGVVGDEGLYRIPGSSRATLVAMTTGAPLSIYAPGQPVAIDQHDNGDWTMVVSGSSPQMLRLRLTAVPGWRATIDGRPLTLTTWADHTMLEAVVPPGRHVVELSYWPRLFSAGILIALGTAAAFLLVVPATLFVYRRRRALR